MYDTNITEHFPTSDEKNKINADIYEIVLK